MASVIRSFQQPQPVAETTAGPQAGRTDAVSFSLEYTVMEGAPWRVRPKAGAKPRDWYGDMGWTQNRGKGDPVVVRAARHMEAQLNGMIGPDTRALPFPWNTSPQNNCLVI